MQYVTEKKKHASGRPLTVTSYDVVDLEFGANKSALYFKCLYTDTHKKSCVLTSCSQCDQRLVGN